MRPKLFAALPLLLGMIALAPARAQLGKPVMIPAGSEVDRQLKAINAASDPAQKVKLIDEFSAAHTSDDFAIIANEQYVNYYLAAKQYDKVFSYGEKLFALDPDNYANAVNMVRAANEKGDTEKIYTYGEKAGAILQRFRAAPAPQGTSAEFWDNQKTQTLSAIKDDQAYIEQSMLSAAYQQQDAAKRAGYMERAAKAFPDSPNAMQALSAAALAYQQAQNRAKMQEVANAILAKDPDNIGMLILLADDYSEKSEQLDKAETYAKKAAALCDTAKKPESLSDDQWKQQNSLQKGLAFSALGQVNIERKQNAQAVESLAKAAPLLKTNAFAYARNQYRLGYAYLNLKRNPEAKQAFTEAASVESPYKQMADAKLKELAGAKPGARKKGS